jgi:hypothetical protein
MAFTGYYPVMDIKKLIFKYGRTKKKYAGEKSSGGGSKTFIKKICFYQI